ncbi:patatin family protein, partial [Acinetobacter baumannii]
RLRNLIARYVTPDLLQAIAEEHAKGRRLLVVTTNLDTQRAVIWNMGAIAASGAPNAVSLFTDVLTASASIPAVFPPQLLDVQAE